MTEVRWSDASLDELASLKRRYNRRVTGSGDALAARILLAVDRVETFPRIGRVVPEYGQEQLREVIVSPFRVVYRIAPDHIEVSAIFHGSMLLDADEES
jgi:plasmid stabilization system protein ParE